MHALEGLNRSTKRALRLSRYISSGGVAVRMEPARKVSDHGYPVRRLDTAMDIQNSGGSEILVGGGEVADEADIGGALIPNTSSGGGDS